jgi:hypothetical protein|tara:strand:- start:457 stop:564 length:108 start_codon:yes stop_codon:yes gene_type:complete
LELEDQQTQTPQDHQEVIQYLAQSHLLVVEVVVKT